MTVKPANLLFLILTVLVVGYGLLFLSQLWLGWIAAEIFFKLTITVFILTGLIGLVWLIKREVLDEGKMKKDDYLD